MGFLKRVNFMQHPVDASFDANVDGEQPEVDLGEKEEEEVHDLPVQRHASLQHQGFGRGQRLQKCQLVEPHGQALRSWGLEGQAPNRVRVSCHAKLDKVQLDRLVK